MSASVSFVIDETNTGSSSSGNGCDLFTVFWTIVQIVLSGILLIVTMPDNCKYTICSYPVILGWLTLSISVLLCIGALCCIMLPLVISIAIPISMFALVTSIITSDHTTLTLLCWVIFSLWSIPAIFGCYLIWTRFRYSSSY